MEEPLPEFDNPPVVETILSAQFERLLNFRMAHVGCFWQESQLDKDWRNLQETSRIDDVFERFGDERRWGMPGIRFFSSPEARTQISRTDGTRMIQIQDSRFVYNWKKADVGYPSFSQTSSEFTNYYNDFKRFIRSVDVGVVEENQWEITYINHLLKGELWDSPDDWHRIFPWLKFPSSRYTRPDYLTCEWSSVIGQGLGRLHTNLTYGRVAADGPIALVLNLTARGAVSPQASSSIESGLQLGHEIIVRTFADMTSEYAHQFWKRRH